MPATYQSFRKSMDKFGTEGLMQMDPKLQQILILSRNGIRNASLTSVDETEVSVFAKVSDMDSWKECTDVRAPVYISESSEAGYFIVTGRIPIRRVETIRNYPFIASLKAARTLKPTLVHTLKDMQTDQLPGGGKNRPGGEGTIVGIIDYGCDFAHQNFQVNGVTRISTFWNQSHPSTLPNGLPGKIYSATELNKALKNRNPYNALGYRPGDKAHGTHVMDIAAGNGNGSGNTGVASQADIIFVELDSKDLAWRGAAVIQQNFGDSVNLIEAIRFIFDKAGETPCVINISLGTNGGPHDGTTLVEQSIDGMLAEKPNRCVVIAASNSFEDGIHTNGDIAPGKTIDLPWVVLGNDATENEMEVWYPGRDKLSVEIINPAGESLGTVEPGESGTVRNSEQVIQLVISNRQNDPNNHDNNIGIWLKENQGGTWTIRLKNTGTESSSFHAWIERDDNGQSNFGQAKRTGFSLGSISCSKNAITVAAYDATVSSSPISPFSSEGPTRDGRQKPEISAPGSKIIAARSESSNGTTPMSGTSMASPAVTGAISVLFGLAKSKGLTLDINQLRKIVTESGQMDPPRQIWDSRYGNGRISLAKLIGGLGQNVRTTASRNVTNRKASDKQSGVTQRKKTAGKKSK